MNKRQKPQSIDFKSPQIKKKNPNSQQTSLNNYFAINQQKDQIKQLPKFQIKLTSKKKQLNKSNILQFIKKQQIKVNVFEKIKIDQTTKNKVIQRYLYQNSICKSCIKDITNFTKINIKQNIYCVTCAIDKIFQVKQSNQQSIQQEKNQNSKQSKQSSHKQININKQFNFKQSYSSQQPTKYFSKQLNKQQNKYSNQQSNKYSNKQSTYQNEVYTVIGSLELSSKWQGSKKFDKLYPQQNKWSFRQDMSLINALPKYGIDSYHQLKTYLQTEKSLNQIQKRIQYLYAIYNQSLKQKDKMKLQKGKNFCHFQQMKIIYQRQQSRNNQIKDPFFIKKNPQLTRNPQAILLRQNHWNKKFLLRDKHLNTLHYNKKRKQFDLKFPTKYQLILSHFQEKDLEDQLNYQLKDQLNLSYIMTRYERQQRQQQRIERILVETDLLQTNFRNDNKNSSQIIDQAIELDKYLGSQFSSAQQYIGINNLQDQQKLLNEIMSNFYLYSEQQQQKARKLQKTIIKINNLMKLKQKGDNMIIQQNKNYANEQYNDNNQTLCVNPLLIDSYYPLDQIESIINS